VEREIPKNWILTELGEIATWGSGGTPRRGNDLYFNGTIPWIKTGELNDNIIYDTDEKITELALKNSSAKIFPKGSIAIAMYGATIGKTGVLGIDASTNQACAIAQAYNGISSKYLHYYLISEKQNFIEKGKGGAQPNISQTVIKQHNFPLAPFNEQTRIVVKLDQLFSHLNKLKERLDSIPELLKQFRQAVLTKAVTGKLTEEWREGKNVKTPTPLALREIGQVTGGITLNSKRRTLDIQMPYMRVGNVYSNMILLNEIKYIGVTENEKKRTLLEKGDLLIVEGNGSATQIGRVARWNGEIENCVHQNHLIKFRCNKDNESKFVLFFLLSINGRRQIEEISKSTSGLFTLNISKVSNLQIDCPELIEQTEIVRQVEFLYAKADKLETQYKALKEKIEDLPQAILAKAFRGELVEQLPSDGDARTLLEEITKLKLQNQGKNNYNTNNKKISRAAEDEVIYKE